MWMKTDFDLGIPFVNIVVLGRSAAGTRIFNLLREHRINTGYDAKEQEVTAIAQALTEVIVQYRPELAGCIITSINKTRYDEWSLAVIHPNLLRLPFGYSSNIRLEKCASCAADVDASSMMFSGANHEPCCSLQCAEATKGKEPTFISNPHRI